MSQQLSFDLPVRTALGRDDFFVSAANAMALAMIESWANWGGGKLLLIGPSGAGKTHLTHVWAALTGATILPAQHLNTADIPSLAQGPVAVEDVPLIAGDAAAQTALFHLHNLVLAEGHPLLLSGTSEPQFWGLSLADLISRLQGTGVARLEQPDDALLLALLAKLFSDRQLSPPPNLMDYLVRRIDRSYQAARDIVQLLDETALNQGRALNRALAIEVLEQGNNGPQDT